MLINEVRELFHSRDATFKQSRVLPLMLAKE